MTLICNPIFEEKTLYTFDEVIEIFLVNTISPHPSFPLKSSEDVFKCLTLAGEMTYNGLNHTYSNDYSISFVQTIESELVCSQLAINLLNKLKLRYADHWAIMCNDDTNETKVANSKGLFRKIFNLMDYTFPKYSLLFELYENKRANMLDKLARTRSGSREISSEGETSDNTINLFNDTPQTTDVIATIEGNQYVSELNKGSNAGTSSSSGTDEFSEEEEFDTKTIMEKLDEIQRNYAQLWKSWLDEFDQLFIEEVNF